MLKTLTLLCSLLLTVSLFAQSPSKALKASKKLVEQGATKDVRYNLIKYYDESGKLKNQFTELLVRNYLDILMPDSAIFYLEEWKKSGLQDETGAIDELSLEANLKSLQSKTLANEAKSHFENKEYELAYKKAKKSVGMDSIHALPYWVLANLRNERKDYDKANQLYQLAESKRVAVENEKDKIRYDYGMSLHTQRENEKSNKVLNGIKSPSLLARAQLLKAKNYLQLRQYKSCFQNIGLYLQPKNNLSKEQEFEGYYFKGVAYQQRGDEKGAIEALEKAKAIQPKSAKVLGELGDLYFEIKNYSKSLENFNALHGVTSPTSLSFHKVGNCHFQLGALADAEYAYKEAIKLAPNNPKIEFNIGLIAFKNNDFESAQKIWEPLIDKSKNDPTLTLALCKLYRSQKNYEKAEELMNTLLKSYPVIGTCYEEQALLYKELGKEEEAKAAEAKAVKNARNKLALTVQ